MTSTTALNMRYTLDIKIKFGKLGVKIERGEFNIRLPGPEDVIQLRQEPPELKLKTTYPELELNLSRCFYDMGLKPYHELARDIYNESKNSILNFIEKKAREGDILADSRGLEEFLKIVEEESFGGEKEINTAAVPESFPRGDLKEGKVEIEYIPGRIKVKPSYKTGRVIFKKAKVYISLAENPYIKIKALPIKTTFDKRV
ncbi:DUF6470 family protein [Thermoanaerobacterium sp. DL9XJH110]|uniref:DUF6470 family protein n=1 Tax=Thermoanaerobacterium sp. DL9XJH110 TaxID=3386643 RepID=UPI003BB6549A